VIAKSALYLRAKTINVNSKDDTTQVIEIKLT